MIKENKYFADNVKSLGYAREGGHSTVGVMNAGEYEFNTGGPEVMTVIEGNMLVLLPGNTEWKEYGAGEAYDVPGDSLFKVKVTGQTSYLCQY